VSRESCRRWQASVRSRWTRPLTSCFTCARRTHPSPRRRPSTSRRLRPDGRRTTSTSAATACTSCTTLTSTQTDQWRRRARPAQGCGGGGGNDGNDRERLVAAKRRSDLRPQTKLPCTSRPYNLRRTVDAVLFLILNDLSGLSSGLLVQNITEPYF